MRHTALMVLTTAAITASSLSAHGKAHVMDLPAAVAVAEAIAVVQVETSEKVPGRQKGYWTYSQRNTFRFLEFVKRAPSVESVVEGPQVLWAEKDFICASESFHPGQYLVFLESVEPGEWIAVNHHRGVLPIEQGMVPWPYAEKFDEKRTVALAKAAVARAKAEKGMVRFVAEIVGSFYGLYNRWMPSRGHQVLVFHLKGKTPSVWPAEHLFARAVVPRGVADQATYEAWARDDGELSVKAEWVDGSLVIREARRLSPK